MKQKKREYKLYVDLVWGMVWYRNREEENWNKKKLFKLNEMKKSYEKIGIKERKSELTRKSVIEYLAISNQAIDLL